MRALHCTIVLGIMAIALSTRASGGEDRSFTLLERELEYLVAIWPGDYDNVEQLTFEATAGKADVASGGHVRVHATVTRVEVPALGAHVLYLAEYKDNDPASVSRRRLYALVADEDANALRVRQYTLADGLQWPVDVAALRELVELQEQHLRYRAGCDLLFRRDGDWLAGSIATPNCMADLGYLDYDVRVSQEQYWFRQQLRNPQSDEVAEQIADFGWYQLERARWFACMLDFPREPGGRPVETLHYIKLHDQGGTFAFTHPDGRDMVLTMRNTWSYGMQRETFVIVVQEGSTTGPTLVYAWGNPGADRIGMNPGYLRVQCDADTPRQVQLQHWLRPDS